MMGVQKSQESHAIDETTGRSKWDGRPMDAAMAVEGPLAA